MKQLISIIGNICTGKSQVCQAIQELNPQYTYLAIDEFRLKYGDGKKAGEQLAYQKLHEVAMATDLVILESSGTSDKIAFLMGEFEKAGGNILIVRMDCSRDLMLERLMEREQSDYPAIPFPYAISKEEAIQNIDYKLINQFYHESFYSNEESPTEIARKILAKVKAETKPVQVKKPKKQPPQIKAITQIKHCLAEFKYDVGFELFKKYQPQKTYVIAKLERARKSPNKRGERLLKRELQALLSNPFALLEKSALKPVVNYTKVAEDVPGKSPRKIHHYPEALQQLIIKKSGLIAGKKKLSNALFELKEKPEKASTAVAEILRLKAEIDSIDKAQSHFERNDKLPNKLERQLEIVPENSDKLHLSIRNTRSRMSKLRAKITRAKSKGEEGLVLTYGNQLEKEELLLKKYLAEKEKG